MDTCAYTCLYIHAQAPPPTPWRGKKTWLGNGSVVKGTFLLEKPAGPRLSLLATHIKLIRHIFTARDPGMSINTHAHKERQNKPSKVACTLRSWRRRHQEFKVILDYITSLRPIVFTWGEENKRFF